MGNKRGKGSYVIWAGTFLKLGFTPISLVLSFNLRKASSATFSLFFFTVIGSVRCIRLEIRKFQIILKDENFTLKVELDLHCTP